MILVAEAGGSKTDWRLLSEEGKVDSFITGGYNATVGRDLAYFEGLKAAFSNHRYQVKTLYFYGAGVEQSDAKSLLLKRLKEVFAQANIEVISDVIAAGRALFGKDAGMVGIIGTGAAVGEFKNDKMNYRVASLGYALGDEGSGYYLGKKLVQLVLRKGLEDELLEDFYQQFPDFSEDKVLQQVYKEEGPNKAVADYARFLIQNQTNLQILEVIRSCFDDFFNAFHLRSEEVKLKWRFCGSVAYHCQSILKEVAKSRGIIIDQIIKSPIVSLTKFHEIYG